MTPAPDKSNLALVNENGRLRLYYRGERIPGVISIEVRGGYGERAVVAVEFDATAVRLDTKPSGG